MTTLGTASSLVGPGMVAAWEQQCELIPGAVLYRHDGLVVAVGTPGGPSSAVVLVEEPPVDPRHGLEAAEALCAAHAAPVAVEAAAGAHPLVEAALVDAGFRPGLRRPAMVAALSSRPELPPGVAPSRVEVPDGIRIRSARAADLAALRALDVSCFGMAPAVAAQLQPAAALADPARWTMVAEDATVPGKSGATVVLAKAHGHRHRGAVGVMGVATNPAVRGAGLATAVVAQLLARAAAEGIGSAWLVAEPGATSLYRRLGFQPAGDWLTWAKS